MPSLILLAVLGHVALGGLATIPPSTVWEESPAEQKMPGYHPYLRFDSWEITRFNRSTTYMFVTPDFIQQGQFQVQGNHYYFRAVMANELENSDKEHLMADMGPDQAREFDKAYARSMNNFEGAYNKSNQALVISYPVKGVWKRFELHSMTQGDEQLANQLSGPDRGLAGLWQAPDPYPERLDARTRTKIDERGVGQFAREASESDGAVFGLLDLRVDKTFRSHALVGTWQLTGSTLALMAAAKTTYLQVSPGGRKLLTGGKTAYVR